MYHGYHVLIHANKCKLHSLANVYTSDNSKSAFSQVFVKCHFDYDPASDNLIPCKEAGLQFGSGDILQIVNQEDVNWWQVRLARRDGQQAFTHTSK